MKHISLILSFILNRIWFLLAVLLIVFILCELYMRNPLTLPQIEYQPDNDLIAMFKPTQRGFDWLANMSYKSPPMTLNNEGHRGKDTDWSQPVILTTGNSDSFGVTVSDDEVWTARLESMLRNEAGLEHIQVVNASHPGAGPYQHYIRIKRVLESHPVNAVIVRVEMADRYFVPPDANTRDAMLKAAYRRQSIKKYTKGLPYLYNKFSAQLPSIKKNFKPAFIKGDSVGSSHSQTEGIKMWNNNREWWLKIYKLAHEKNIPIVFMVYDVWGSDGARVLIDRLAVLTSGDQNTYVFTLGSESFGLTSNDRDQRRIEFNSRYTFARDPHANPLQHAVIARAVYDYLVEQDFINKYLRTTS